MAVTASFASNTLSVDGDTLDNTITVSTDPDSNIVVNNDTVPITGGPVSTINTTLIEISGSDGADTITLDETFGPLPNAIVTGGRGDDIATLGSGDDTFVWNPGDGSDTVDGMGGTDTLQFNGANVNEQIDISANGSHARFTRDVANITMDLNGAENIAFTARGGADKVTVGDMTGTDVKQVAIDLSAAGDGGAGDGQADTVIVNATGSADAITVSLSGSQILVNGLVAQTSIVGQEGANDALVINALGDADTIDASGLAAGQVKLTIDGGDGNDIIIGSAGADTLIGGDGNDTVTGGRGDDVAFLGADDDTFIWNPGDGSDIVEGQGGTDTLQFNGANVAERFDISANGGRVRFTRDVANITMDINSVEKIALKTLGGADTITVNDLTGTGTQQVAIDLSASGGGGDGAADNVIVNGTATADSIILTQAGSQILVDGLAAEVAITGYEPGDTLTINALAGGDTINASAIAAGQIKLVLNGGDNDDIIVGSAGDDSVTGGRGGDTALLGGGNDLFTWNPGDGSDIVEGMGGTDTLQFNGANVNEQIEISANGSRARFTRDVANITMDLNGVENIAFTARGGADKITVGDMTGTDVKQVAIDLSAAGDGGTGDGQADNVIVNATNGADAVTVSSSGTQVTVNGLAAQTAIAGSEAANDQLQINGLGGADTIDASAMAAGLIKLTLNGGGGNDIIIGSAGNDVLTGGGGATDDDTFVFRPGGGADIITDFTAGLNIDEIDLRAFTGLHSLADVLALATQAGTDTVIDFGGGNTLTLQNVTKTALDASDFILKGPTALSVAASGTGITAGNGDLNAGHDVFLTVAFDEAAIVTGAPKLLLNDGGAANYVSGSGTAALVFKYTVAAGENTADLTVTAAGLNGGTVRDGNGTNADLSAAVANPAGILQIDTTAPGAPTIALTHDTGVSSSDGLTSDPAFTATSAEAGGTLLYKADGAASFSATKPVFAVDGSADGHHTVSVEQQDAAGNIGPAATLTFTLDTLAPSAPAAALVHDTGTSGSDGLTNDPAFTATGAEAGGTLLYKADGTASFSTTKPVFAVDGSADGNHTVSVEQQDAAGNVGAVASLNFRLDTIAPQATGISASPASGTEDAGSQITFTLAFNEAVGVSGGTPALLLNDGGTAQYDSAATAALHDATKLVFDYVVSPNDAVVTTLAVTGIDQHGAAIADLAGNAAVLSGLATSFTGLSVDPHGFAAPPHLADFHLV
jgi:hypothetical protein